MTCAHCKRELAGVAVIFGGKPAVCGRADCLCWARALVVAVPGGEPQPDRALESHSGALPAAA